MEEIDHVLVVRAESRGVVAGAAEAASFIGEITESEETADGEIERGEERERIAGAASEDDSVAERLAVFERLHGHEESAADAPEIGGDYGHVAAPDGERDIYGASGGDAQNAVEDCLADDFGAVAIAAGEGGGEVDR